MNFRENFKKDMKKCDHHIADLRKQLASRYAAVEKVRGPGGGRLEPAGALRVRQRSLSLHGGSRVGGTVQASSQRAGRSCFPLVLRPWSRGPVGAAEAAPAKRESGAPLGSETRCPCSSVRC